MQINESPECRVWIIFPDGRPPTPIKEDGINKYYMSSKLTFVNSEVNKVNLYLIYIDKNGNFSVNEELTDKININDSSSYNFVTTFTNNKEKYQLQIKLMF